MKTRERKTIFLAVLPNGKVLYRSALAGSGEARKILEIFKEDQDLQEVTKPSSPPMLSDREIQIVELVLEGKRVKEVAGQLGLSPFTVETHKRSVFKKMGVNNAAQLGSVFTRLKAEGLV